MLRLSRTTDNREFYYSPPPHRQKKKIITVFAKFIKKFNKPPGFIGTSS